MVSDEQTKQLLIQQCNKEIEMKGKLTFAQRLAQDSNIKQIQVQRQNTRKDRKKENGKDKGYSQFREQCIEIKNMLKMLENEEDKDCIHSPFLKVLTPTNKNLPYKAKQTKLIGKQLTPSCEQAKQNKWQSKWLTFTPQSYKANNQKSLHNSDPIIPYKNRELPIEFHSISKKGIANHGNTCYINSLLQCLFHLPHFNDYFATREFQTQQNGIKKQVVQMYRKLYCDINTTQKIDISTLPLKQSLSQACSLFLDWQQQDAHEFMEKLLNSIHEQLNRVENKNKVKYRQLGKELESQSLQKMAEAYWSYVKQRDDSYIYDNFEGQTYNSVRCIDCNQESHTFDNFLDLSVPITPLAKSLQGLLQDYFQPQKLADYYHCSSCNKSSKRSTKTVQLWRVPKFLIIHLKRSQLQRKNVEPITIPQSLTVKPFMGSSNDKTARLCQYTLCGVVMHEGIVQGGHYWANVRERGKWYEMNDEKIKEINGEDFKRGLEDIGSRNAYILFYSSLYA